MAARRPVEVFVATIAHRRDRVLGRDTASNEPEVADFADFASSFFMKPICVPLSGVLPDITS